MEDQIEQYYIDYSFVPLLCGGFYQHVYFHSRIDRTKSSRRIARFDTKEDLQLFKLAGDAIIYDDYIIGCSDDRLTLEYIQRFLI